MKFRGIGPSRNVEDRRRMGGDDMLQRRAGRVLQSHRITHRISQQRQRWFATGYRIGEAGQCDTFGAARL